MEGKLWIVVLVVIGILVALFVVVRAIARAGARAVARAGQALNERMETLFQASFPDLQPHFHPKNVYEYAKARQARKASSGPFKWRNPPGFASAVYADVEPDGLRDNVRLLDAREAVLANFVFEEHPEGAVIRLGKGKFTVGLKGPEPRVRYWHPDREFKWTPKAWKMKTGVSDQSLQSRDDDHRSASSSSDSVSPATTAAAAAAGIVAAGGTFDGGGASAAWDDSGGGASGSSSGGSPDFAGVESGSSSTDSGSTSY